MVIFKLHIGNLCLVHVLWLVIDATRSMKILKSPHRKMRRTENTLYLLSVSFFDDVFNIINTVHFLFFNQMLHYNYFKVII